MKFLTVLCNRTCFLLLVSIFSLVVVQTSNGMMPSKKHKKISSNRAQSARAKTMKSPVWVKTNDNYVVAIEQWKIDQMNVLQVIFEDQNGSNSRKNPIVKPEKYEDEQWITRQELQLLSNALSAASAGQFEEFYKTHGASLRLLINAAGKVEATGISALFGTYYFPQEMQRLVAKDMVQPVIEYIQQNIHSQELVGHPKSVNSVACSSDGKKIVSGGDGDQNNLIVWNAEDGSQSFNLAWHPKGVKCVAFSSDGKMIASGGYGNQDNLIVWNVEDRSRLLNLAGHSKAVSSVKFNSDGKKIVSGSWGDKDNLIVWNAENGSQLLVLKHSKGVNSVAFSPNGKMIVSGGVGDQNNLIVWNAEDGSELFNLVGHHGGVNSVAFSPDGKRIVSGGWGDKDNLIVWSAEDGSKLFKLVGHHGGVNSVAFSSDGKMIVSGNVIVWNAENGSQLINFIGCPAGVTSVVFSSDGKKIVTGGYGVQNNLTVWGPPFDLINTVEKDLTIAQVRLLYQMHCAAQSGKNMILKKNTIEYVVYETLPEIVKNEVGHIFPVMLEEYAVEGQ